MKDSEIFIVGANGQLGLALKERYPGALFADIDELDITSKPSVAGFDWSQIKVVLNAAAYTNVDGAETPEGRVTAWNVNASAARNLVEAALQHGFTLVHISSDYVFDGSQGLHSEEELFSPLSVYGASKAAGDIVMQCVKRFYIIRTSWVIGEGNNFVRTMLGLGKKGINPSVVSDQIGRLTFTSELVRAIDHLITNKAPYGTYNLSNSGDPASWADVTRQIFKQAGLDNTVTNVTTAEYYKDKAGIAPRPLQSTLDLAKIESTGFKPIDWKEGLKQYIAKEKS